jgi:hypothetical protein
MKGKATIYYTDGHSEEMDHKPTMKELQKLVGGYVEIVVRTVFNPTFEGQMIVNEDGVSMNLPVNAIGTTTYGGASKIVGNIVILTDDWMLD